MVPAITTRTAYRAIRLAAFLVMLVVAILLASAQTRTASAAINGVNVLIQNSEDGQDPEVVLDMHGNPIVLSHDEDSNAVLIHCDDPMCAAGGESSTTLGVGTSRPMALTLSPRGWATALLYDGFSPQLVQCMNSDCTTSVTSTFGSPIIDKGEFPSVAYNPSGNPVTAFYSRASGDLRTHVCTLPDCSTFAFTPVDTTGDVGQYTSLRIDAAGKPVIAYYDVTNGDLKVVHCGDSMCFAGNVFSSPDTGGDVGQYASLALDSAGRPVVAYYDVTNQDLKLLHCNDINCAPGGDSIAVVDSAGNVGANASLELTAAGLPIISYTDFTGNELKVVHCDDVNCAPGGNRIHNPDAGAIEGVGAAMVLDARGNPVVAYTDDSVPATQDWQLKLLHCTESACLPGVVDEVAVVSSDVPLALAAGDMPAVSYLNAAGDLEVVRCNDIDCANSDDTHNQPDPSSIGVIEMTLDASGHPVVMHRSASTTLRLVHCDDIACAPGGDSVTSAYIGAATLAQFSIALTASGNPVLAFLEFSSPTGGAMTLLFCNDPNCTGGDETVVRPLGALPTISTATMTMRLDASGFPVIAYDNKLVNDPSLLRCTSALCGTFTDVQFSEANTFAYPSLAIDSGGFGVIATLEIAAPFNLNIKRCLNAACSVWVDESPAAIGNSIMPLSLALSPSGLPRIAYIDQTANSRMKIMLCNDAFCSGGDETIVSPDGRDFMTHPSIAMDSTGAPVVAYGTSTGGATLKILRCGTANCTVDADQDRVTDASDNCVSDDNPGQDHTDRNFVDNSPPYAPSVDDKTWPNSDTSGDACDLDDDNDGLVIGAENAGCNGSGPLLTHLRDTDGDRFLDTAECILASDPGDASSKPALAACGPSVDSDGDKIGDRLEFCFYGTSNGSVDTDGDAGTDGAKDGCEVASLNGDRIVSSIDQGMLASGIIAFVPYTANVDLNKDGVLSSIDQGMMASFIVPPGQCP